MSSTAGTALAVRPRWRGRLHAWAFIASIPAGLALLIQATALSARIGAGIFAVTLAGVFGTSAAYHRGRGRVPLGLLRRADHSMIYLLIAGTYTPVCLGALPPSVGRPLLISVWVAAAVGVICKLAGGPALMRLSSLLYLLLGWAGIVALPALVRSVSPTVLGLLVAGGLIYTAGAVVLTRRHPDPRPAIFGYHELWHACTILAASAHFAMVWLVAA
jgi:hemolysin III